MEPKKFNQTLYSPVPTETVFQSDTNNENFKQPSGPKFGKRHIQVVSYFLFVVLELCEKSNMSMALVAMTDRRSTKNPNVPVYNWTDKGVILSSYSWGYVLAQPFVGWLGNRYGCKWFLVGSLGTSCIAGMFIPILAVYFGSKGVMAARIVQGLSQSCLHPSLHGILAKWIPQNEKTRTVVFVYSGAIVGTMISFYLSGFIASTWYGWPMLFYVFGAIGLVCCLFYSYSGAEGPDSHSTITTEEKCFILNSLKHCDFNKTKLSVPWLKIFTSLPVWSIFLTECGMYTSYWVLLAELPAYLAHCMKFNIKSNSILSSLPFGVKLIFVYVFCYISELLVRRKTFTLVTIRKIFNVIGMVIPAVAFLWLGNTGPDDASLAVALLVITVTAKSALYCCVHLNYFDIAPNYAGLLAGLINGVSSSIGIIAPLLVQFIVTDEDNPDQWKIVFYISGIISIAASAFYITFASADLQTWNTRPKSQEEKRFQA